MVSRRGVLAATLAALPLSLGAQPARRRKLGILGIGEAAGFFGGQRRELLEELARRGYVPGHTLDIEERFEMESPEKLAANARELVALGVDAIVTEGTVSTLAAQAATRSIPIVT